MTQRSPRRSRRGFTLVELIVTILIVGVLAAIATIAYSTLTDRAHVARVQENLRNVAQLTVVRATLDDADILTRDLLTVAIEEGIAGVSVVDGIEAAQTWRLGRADQSPTAETDLAVAFDYGDGAGQDAGGTRAVLLATAGKNLYARVIIWEHGAAGGLVGDGGPVPSGTTPSDVLADPTLIGQPGEGEGGGDPVYDTNPGVEMGGTDFGDLDVTLSGYAGEWNSEGTHYQSVDAEVSSAPAGIATGDHAGLWIWCTVDVPVEAASWTSWVDPADVMYASWGTIDPIAPTTRTYTCTVEALDGTGTVLARRTLTATVGPGSPPPPPPTGVMTMTWDTTAPGCPDSTLGLPVATQTGTVDWGDGTTQNLTYGIEHTYATPGRYAITIDGSFSDMNMGYMTYGDAACLISVDSWAGDTGTQSLAQAFWGASNLVSVAKPPSGVWSMRSAFQGATSFNQDISDWDTSNVSDMSSMFSSASSFNQDISGWDTSKVENMFGMFAEANSFNQNLGAWDTSRVTNMRSMFLYNSAFNGDISGWDTSRVSDAFAMFRGASAFNQDLSGWRMTSAVYRDYFDDQTPSWTKAKPAFS